VAVAIGGLGLSTFTGGASVPIAGAIAGVTGGISSVTGGISLLMECDLDGWNGKCWAKLGTEGFSGGLGRAAKQAGDLMSEVASGFFDQLTGFVWDLT
jgi:hypothetical protein